MISAVLAVAVPTAVAAVVPAAATPAPSPSPSSAVTVDPNLGSPGILGFVFTFVLALALIALVLSLARQLRKVDRNARLAAVTEADDERASREPAAADDEPGRLP